MLTLKNLKISELHIDLEYDRPLFVVWEDGLDAHVGAFIEGKGHVVFRLDNCVVFKDPEEFIPDKYLEWLAYARKTAYAIYLQMKDQGIV